MRGVWCSGMSCSHLHHAPAEDCGIDMGARCWGVGVDNGDLTLTLLSLEFSPSLLANVHEGKHFVPSCNRA